MCKWAKVSIPLWKATLSEWCFCLVETFAAVWNQGNICQNCDKSSLYLNVVNCVGGFHNISRRVRVAQSVERLGYGLDNQGSIFPLCHHIQTGSGTHPAPSPFGMGGGFPLEVKWQGHEADQSPPSSAKVKNALSYTSTPQYVFMAWCLVNHRQNFFYLYMSMDFILHSHQWSIYN
jgi:hypothetical protein